ncbi:MAG: PorP/SprF family type IX secretion system membrane protein [Bacteroidetes bacterium]|nr:PorP/SprF family type IX secretion system membrane protein [Bacteroidota bacterium]
MKRYFCLLILVFSIQFLFAQDHIISGFASSPLSFNPATTGTFGNQNLRVYTGYGWDHFPVLFDDNSINLSVDKSLLKEHLGIGVNLLHGFGNDFENTDYAMLSAAYHSGFLDNQFTYSFGLQGGLLKHSVDWDQMIYRDPISPIYDSVYIYPTDHIMVGDFNLGTLIFRNGDMIKIRPWIGFSVSHIFEPNLSLLNLSYPLPRKLIIHAGSHIRLNRFFVFTPRVMYSRQKDYRTLDLEGTMKYQSGKFLVSLGNSYEHSKHDFFDINQVRLLASIGYAGLECRMEFLLLEFNQLVDINQSTGFIGLCWNLHKSK